MDQGIGQIEKVIRDYYNDDGKTTFLMTSDHGMTDWGKYCLSDLEFLKGSLCHFTLTPYHTLTTTSTTPLLSAEKSKCMSEQ